MAMPVNFAFLVPQAMINGLTKLFRWVSSARGCQGLARTAGREAWLVVGTPRIGAAATRKAVQGAARDAPGPSWASDEMFKLLSSSRDFSAAYGAARCQRSLRALWLSWNPHGGVPVGGHCVSVCSPE